MLYEKLGCFGDQVDGYLSCRVVGQMALAFSSLLLLCTVCFRVGRSLIRSNNRASRYVAFQFLLIWFCCVYSKLIYLQWYHGTIHHFTKSCLALAPQNCKWEPLERGRHPINKYEPRKPHAVFILLIEKADFWWSSDIFVVSVWAFLWKAWVLMSMEALYIFITVHCRDDIFKFVIWGPFGCRPF